MSIVVVGQASAAATPTAALAFTSYRDGISSVYITNADGTGQQRLTATARPAFEGQPAYSPDGGRIAYVCGNFELCVMNADGSAQQRLTTSNWPASWQYVEHPSWSPDGSKIAFATNSGGSFHIYAINANGSGLTRLLGAGGDDEDPGWSPDGRMIAFESYHASNGNGAIYVMNANGTGAHRLTSAAKDDCCATWSQDGSRIAFARFDGEDTHLIIMRSDGSDPTALTFGSCDEFDPAWSPDGTRIAFARNCAGSLGIDQINVDGNGLARVTSPTRGFDEFPAWRATPAPTASAPAPAPAPSAATEDARIVGTLYQWDTQVRTIDYLPAESPQLDRKTIADDQQAIAALAGIHPITRRGKLVRKDAMDGFSLEIKSERQYLVSDRNATTGDSKAAATHERAAERLGARAGHKLDAAEMIAGAPY